MTIEKLKILPDEFRDSQENQIPRNKHQEEATEDEYNDDELENKEDIDHDKNIARMGDYNPELSEFPDNQGTEYQDPILMKQAIMKKEQERIAKKNLDNQ